MNMATKHPPGTATPAHFDVYQAIGEIEGSLAIFAGLIEAVDELSAEGRNAERRLSAICAISGAMSTELASVKEANRQLYDFYFAQKGHPGTE